MTNEICKAVVGFETWYEVSDSGRVRSRDREITCASRWGRERTYTKPGRILKGTVNCHGYVDVTLCDDTGPRKRKVHRLVLEAFVGNCPDGMEGCHGDGDPSNNVLSNLRGTRQENADDMVRHGRATAGSWNPNAVLDEDRVRLARRLKRGGSGVTAIAKYLGVHRCTVSYIVSDKLWRAA